MAENKLGCLPQNWFDLLRVVEIELLVEGAVVAEPENEKGQNGEIQKVISRNTLFACNYNQDNLMNLYPTSFIDPSFHNKVVND